jgi:Cu(I)/Ag(I) efflux system membrane fusion protein
VATQREYLLALEGSAKAGEEPGAANREMTQRLTAASRTRLKLWGITDEQIAELERSREPKTVFTVAAPAGGIVRQRLVTTGQYVTEGAPLLAIGQLSTVWVQAEVYEFESPKVSVGDPVVITAEAFPSREFHGRVSFVDPFYNPETRTVRVRVELANPGETLKPDMFVRALLRGRKGTVLAVPDTAVLVTGERAVVWVETEENVFSPRPVRLGHRSKGYWEIVSGLQEGETVVTSGGYLIDSESQLRGIAAAPAASPGTHSPEPAPGHGGHGGK